MRFYTKQDPAIVCFSVLCYEYFLINICFDVFAFERRRQISHGTLQFHLIVFLFNQFERKNYPHLKKKSSFPNLRGLANQVNMVAFFNLECAQILSFLKWITYTFKDLQQITHELYPHSSAYGKLRSQVDSQVLQRD